MSPSSPEDARARSAVSNKVAAGIVRYGWRFPFARTLVSRQPVICLYHGVPARDGAVFEQHVLFLKRHFELVSPAQLENRRKRLDRLRVLLTFDDGFRNNAEVVAPILRKHDVSAIFFVSSRHAVPGQYLWFSYLSALEDHFRGQELHFRGDCFDLSAGNRRRNLERLQKILLGLLPHPAAMYRAIDEELPRLAEFVSERDVADRYAGMTGEQVAELAADRRFSIGVHTIDHPFLTRCEPADALHQIQGNRAWLEAVCGQRCDTIAYPGGDCDARLLSACRTLGFTRGYAVARPVDDRSWLGLPRIGIYSKSTDALGFKMQWGHLIRAMGIPVG
jgi:peptidoglycan/xylan/chitin deacetylase (PgdA/CDA1 family)